MTQRTFLVRVSIVTWSIAWFGLGCRQPEPGNPDARALTRAYEAFQGASATDRTAALEGFKQTRCGTLCAERDACVDYATHLMRAQLLVQKARELGPEDAGGNGAASATELAIIIGGADDASKKASAAEPPCRAALDRLYAAGRGR